MSEDSDDYIYKDPWYWERGFVIKVLVGLVIAGCLYWLFRPPEYTEDQGFEIRMIVETPEGWVSGTSVVHRWQWNAVSFPHGSRAGVKFVGEAVPVPLEDGRVIFLTLWFSDGWSGITQGQSVPWNYEARAKLKSGFAGWVEVPQVDWPDIVYFTDINDPGSVKRFQPESRALGPGYRVLQVSVRNTDERYRSSITEYLPWLNTIQSNLAGGRYRNSDSYASSIDRSAFIREF